MTRYLTSYFWSDIIAALPCPVEMYAIFNGFQFVPKWTVYVKLLVLLKVNGELWENTLQRCGTWSSLTLVDSQS